MATSKIKIDSGSGDVKKWCELCKLSDKSNVAVVYCRTCRQFQCASCSSIHKVPTLADHAVVDVDDNAAGKGDFDMKGLDCCKEHGRRFKFYCKADNVLRCSSCYISYIQKWRGVVDIDTLIDTNEDEMQKIKSRIQKQRFASTVLSSSGSNIKTQIRKDQADRLKKIDQAKDKVLQMFDSFKMKFKITTDEAINDIELDLDSEQASLTETEEQIDIMDTFLDDVATDGNPRQIFTTLNIYNKRLDQIEEQLGQNCEQLLTLNIDFSFNEHLVNLLGLIENFGEITTEKTKLYAPLELQETAAVDIKPPGNYDSVDFLSDGRIVAVDTRNSKCVIMDGKLSELSQSIVEIRPFHVAVMPGNKVAVLSGDQKLSTYTVKEDTTLTKLDTITTTSEFNSLCTLDDKTLVASTIDNEGPVKRVTLEGEETDFDLPWQKSTNYGNAESNIAYISSLDIMVLTDQVANKCYLWNVKEGTWIAVRIKCPVGVCATRSGVIFVCSMFTYSIVQMSPTGHVLGSTHLPISRIEKVLGRSEDWAKYVTLSDDDKRLLVYHVKFRRVTLHLFNIR